jgi:hypothetical protein
MKPSNIGKTITSTQSFELKIKKVVLFLNKYGFNTRVHELPEF